MSTKVPTSDEKLYCCHQCSIKTDISDKFQVSPLKPVCECQACLCDDTDFVCSDCAHQSYLRYTADMGCWCDDTEYMCSDCAERSYARYRYERDQVTFWCHLCESETLACCKAKVYKLEPKKLGFE